MKNYHILPYKGIWPKIHEKAFIAAGACIIGDVTIGEGSGVWFNCVIRGDVMPVTIGKFTNIQDGSVIHVTRKTAPTIIGDRVTIGHKCLLHGCALEDEAFVGMGATIMDGAVLKQQSMLAAGSLLTPGKTIKTHEIHSGSPAKFFREMRQDEIDFLKISADNYHIHALEYLAEHE